MQPKSIPINITIFIIVAVLLLITACGEDTESLTGAGGSFSPGLYRGQAAFIDDTDTTAYVDFRENGNSRWYLAAFNMVMDMPYTFYGVSNTIAFGESSMYTTFGNDLEVAAPLMPASNLPALSDITMTATGMTASIQDTNEITFTSLSATFPEEPVDAETVLTVNVDVNELASKTVLAFVMVGSLETGTAGGLGISSTDASGQAVISVHIPDTAFGQNQTTNVMVMAGDINTNSYALSGEDIPFEEYIGFAAWNGELTAIESSSLNIVRSETNITTISNVMDVAILQWFL